MSSKRRMKCGDCASASPPSKRRKSSAELGVNTCYQADDFHRILSEINREEQDYSDKVNGARVFAKPFTCCALPNFISDASVIHRLREEVDALNFVNKNNDLYRFEQTDDLWHCQGPYISRLRDFLGDGVLGWLQHATGIKLSSRVDATCSRYTRGDTLLCHDDELEGRRIAFILYLVDDWSASDGGALDLFCVDEHGQPAEVVKSLLPAANQFVFFPVTPVSFHQVAEVLSDKSRLSISGWFYGEPFDRPAPYVEPVPKRQPPLPLDVSILFDWVNPHYFNPKVQTKVRRKFERKSELQLTAFLLAEQYSAVLQELSAKSCEWQQRGPANKRHYNQLVKSANMVEQCTRMMSSAPFFLLLSQLTGLQLSTGDVKGVPSSSKTASDHVPEDAPGESTASDGETDCGEDSSDDSDLEYEMCEEGLDGSDVENSLAEDVDAAGCPAGSSSSHLSGNSLHDSRSGCDGPCAYVAVRQWTAGSYTLLHDTDPENVEFALDTQLFFCCDDWDSEHGGFTSYIANGEDEELLTVQPTSNCLALVYRDKETLRFVKHINHGVQQSKHQSFFDIFGIYYE